MESMSEIILKAPTGAMYYSDITKGFYFKGRVTGFWYIYVPSKKHWAISAHSTEPPRGLIPLNLPLGTMANEIRGKSADTVIIDDEVNQPSHYKRKSSDVLRAVRSALLEDGEVEDLECIEAMLSHLSTVDQIRGYLRGSSFKYRWRYEDKDRTKSLRKADWYEDKLLELEEIVEEHNGT